MDEFEYDREKKRHEKQKADIFRWMRVPLDPRDNRQLAKMVRVRLLEILSDVKILSYQGGCAFPHRSLATDV